MFNNIITTVYWSPNISLVLGFLGLASITVVENVHGIDGIWLLLRLIHPGLWFRDALPDDKEDSSLNLVFILQLLGFLRRLWVSVGPKDGTKLIRGGVVSFGCHELALRLWGSH